MKHIKYVKIIPKKKKINFFKLCLEHLYVYIFVITYTMLDIFRGLKSLIKVTHIHIDSPIFRLHYSLTVLILVAFSLIVTTRQYVGNPIDCVHTKDIPEDVLNTYCWIHSTYAVSSAFTKKVGVEVPYPGVETSKDEKDKKVYKYYQWVCFCLFFQVSFCNLAN